MSRTVAVVGTAALLVCGCGSAAVQVASGSLGLGATGPTAGAVTTTTIYTSPDGGIYRNADHVDVLYAGGADVDALAQGLGVVTDWQPLRRLGGLTALVLRIRNDGKAGSDPELNDTQLASDLAPAGTAGGDVRHFYHPMFALAALSARPVASDCSVHLDPGDSADVVLIFPPVRPAARLLWGRYQDFSVWAAYGGGPPGLAARLDAAACAPPAAPPP